MAIHEINAAGGLDLGGRRVAIVAVEEDGASDWPTFARKAEQLIERDQVAALFGGCSVRAYYLRLPTAARPSSCGPPCVTSSWPWYTQSGLL